METILEPLIRSPKFLDYLDELNEVHRREAEARQRFRDSLDEDVRAEFINGEVVIQMTARHAHTMTVRNLFLLLHAFLEPRRLGLVLQEQALTGFPRNDYAPDICFWNAEKAAKFVGETVVYPVPDLIAEVLSSSTEARDRGVKFEDYAAHGVAEYWLVDPEAKTIEQYVARRGKYELIGTLNEKNSLHSTVIAGLELPVNAVFDDQANSAARRQFNPAG
jgi:Uma2 family endonuclease